MPRFLVAKSVARTIRKERIGEATLIGVAEAAFAGIFRADHGDETFKVAVQRPGRGKSHGYRAILGLRTDHRAVFAYLWSKNEFENISEDYLGGLKLFIKAVMDMSDEMLERALDAGELIELAQQPEEGPNREEEDGESEDET